MISEHSLIVCISDIFRPQFRALTEMVEMLKGNARFYFRLKYYSLILILGFFRFLRIVINVVKMQLHQNKQ